jgi:intracellular sulfur oxidation DsrE/DsrF family protein
MKKFFVLLTLPLLISAAGLKVAVAGDYGKQKVVYHINYDDQKRLNATLRNIQNHINAVGKENLDLRVVLHGKGVTLLVYAKEDLVLQEQIDKLKAQGIKFNICENTLRGRKLDYKKDLFEVTEQDIVPSGVAEIAALQAKGYVYLKP